jgi:precorrin-2/cobalt-factor-2 C20-methyltransferase
MFGTLYGIGVGPGDPDLITLKAVKVLKRVAHVFAAASSKNNYSLAFEIIRDHLPEGIPVDRMAFPMTFDSDHLEDAWMANCEKAIEILGQGKDVAFLTLGDPLTFSTFIYLMRKVKLRLPGITIESVPGITAFQAAAACAGTPLSEGEESFTVVSGAKGGDRLKEVISFSDNVILMKTYKQFPHILAKIEEAGLKDNCCFVSRCGLDGQTVEREFHKMTEMDKPNYLSLMIIKKRGLEP